MGLERYKQLHCNESDIFLGNGAAGYNIITGKRNIDPVIFNAIKNDIPTTTLFDSQSNTDNGRYIYKKAEATINDDNNLWLYFGTGNTQKLHEQSNKIKNRVYGIKDKDFPNYVNISTPGDIRRCKTAPACPGTTDLGWYANLPRAQKLTA